MQIEEKKSPKVVIILLTYKQLHYTLPCLDSIYNNDYPNFEVILVNNFGEDNTSEEVNKLYPQTIVINTTENLGCAKGRNLGIQLAENNLQYKYFLFLDNDTVVTPNFLTELVNKMESNSDIGISYSKLLYLENPEIVQFAGKISFNYYTGKLFCDANDKLETDVEDTPIESELSHGGSFIIRRELAIKVNGYDPIFDPYGYEDLDFILRSTKKKAKIYYVPSSKVYHKSSRTISEGKYSKFYAKLKARNLRIFLSRHAAFHQKILFNIIAPFEFFSSLIREFSKGNYKAPFALIRGFFSR